MIFFMVPLRWHGRGMPNVWSAVKLLKQDYTHGCEGPR
jgi:hypothetical protein